MRRLLWHPLHLTLGLGVWAAWFVAVYGGVSVLCSVDPAAQALPGPWALALGLLCVGTAGALALLARASAQAVRQAPDPATRFIVRLCAGLDALAAVATLVVGLPLLWLPPCV